MLRGGWHDRALPPPQQKSFHTWLRFQEKKKRGINATNFLSSVYSARKRKKTLLTLFWRWNWIRPRPPFSLSPLSKKEWNWCKKPSALPVAVLWKEGRGKDACNYSKTLNCHHAMFFVVVVPMCQTVFRIIWRLGSPPPTFKKATAKEFVFLSAQTMLCPPIFRARENIVSGKTKSFQGISFFPLLPSSWPAIPNPHILLFFSSDWWYPERSLEFLGPIILKKKDSHFPASRPEKKRKKGSEFVIVIVGIGGKTAS